MASALVAHPERRNKRLLWDRHRSILPHLQLALLLLVEQLALAAGVAAIAFRGHVLAHRADRLAGDHLAADRRLDRDLEQMARDQFLEPLDHAAPPRLGGAAVDDHAQR